MVVFLIEDDTVMSECIKFDLLQQFTDTEIEVLTFRDAIAAIQGLDATLPDVILLNILPNGPNAFSLLNELSSYSDTARIPIILLSSLPLDRHALRQYNIYSILQTETMLPAEIGDAVRGALAHVA